MSKRLGRFRTRMGSGIALLIPLVVTVYVLRVLFSFTAGILLPIIDPAVDNWSPVARVALSLGVLVVIVYLLGEVATHVVGRRLLGLAEALLMRLPIVRVIYRVSKQVVTAFEHQESRAFKAVVFVEFPREGMKSLGFVTSTFQKPDGSEWKTVFIPTTPNPTTGFLQIMPASDVVPTEFTVEEAFKMVMSLGVLSPEAMSRLV